MVQINFGRKEISAKIVYYGPGMSGKTTNLEKVHEIAPQERKGDMTAIATEGDRTLFFDFMPLELGTVAGMNTKLQLYTVPGQVYYDATRKLVLQGADGVIFVADSHPDKRRENIESLDNLEVNLKENGLDIGSIPIVIQYNKRDLPNALPEEELDKDLKRYEHAHYCTASALTGEGVMASLKQMSKMVLADLNKKYGKGHAGLSHEAAKPTSPQAAPAGASPVAPPPPPPPPPAAAQPKPAMATTTQPAPSKQPVAQAAAGHTPPPPPPKKEDEARSVESHIKPMAKKKGFFARLFGK